MVTSQFQLENNKHLLFILPGQSLSSHAFWNFTLPDGKTHTEYFLQDGLDVILFDPVGYGKSREYYQYDRIGYAEQIKTVTDKITKHYISKTILGFSTSTAPALCSAQDGYFDKVIIHSPSIRNDPEYYVKHDVHFVTSMEKLIKSRLEKISDKIIPNQTRLPNWEQSVLSIAKQATNYRDGIWTCPAKAVYDINNYWVEHGNNGFDPSKIKNILSIIGEFDYESKTGGYDTFKKLFPNMQEVVIPNSTHFSMWEKESAKTRASIVKYCLTFNQ